MEIAIRTNHTVRTVKGKIEKKMWETTEKVRTIESIETANQ
jgi:hypothetical protein